MEWLTKEIKLDRKDSGDLKGKYEKMVGSLAAGPVSSGIVWQGHSGANYPLVHSLSSRAEPCKHFSFAS